MKVVTYQHNMIDGKIQLTHRAIMEAHLGRSLSEDEVVHHINGNALDNRIENLEVLTKKEHRDLHTKLEHHKYWTLVVCDQCGKHFEKRNDIIRKAKKKGQQRFYCCRACLHDSLRIKAT